MKERKSQRDYTKTYPYRIWLTTLTASAIMMTYNSLPSLESLLFLTSFISLVYLTYQHLKNG
tara:strand:- start:230 stop:415 length:186 start_codon:yes stop_codon:yes gene_type:complete